jgi:hypothetical protein
VAHQLQERISDSGHRELRGISDPMRWRSSYRELTTTQSYWQCAVDLVCNRERLIDQHLRSNLELRAIAGI